jgi:hypothetical protein
MQKTDPTHLQGDIQVLNNLVDRALDLGDPRLFRAYAEMLRDRRQQLEEELEQLSPLAQRYERALP